MPPMDMARLTPAVAVHLFYSDVLWTGSGLLVAAYVVWMLRRFARPRSGARPPAATPRPAPDLARRVLVVGLGSLWVLDGLLQLQPGMVTSFLSGVVAPLLAGQPAPVAAAMEAGVRLWGVNPIVWNVVATYAQLLIGLSILFGAEGGLRRAGLWASLSWGLIVWIFGEGLGGLFVGGSWFTGLPGSTLLYSVATVLLLLPPESWRRGAWLRPLAAGLAAYWLLSAALQAWPPAGWWSATGLPSEIGGMADMNQPAFLAASLHAFAQVVSRAPAAWNAAMVLGLLGLALAWWRWPDSPATWAATLVWEFLGWWLGMDFGVLGGMGTDPNSGPILMLLVVGQGAARRALAGRRAGTWDGAPALAAASPGAGMAPPDMRLADWAGPIVPDDRGGIAQRGARR